jgi:glutamine amidotransferase
MITVIDSGIANIASVVAALRRVGTAVTVTTDPDVVRNAAALILPGVGAFGDGMASLHRYLLVEPIREAARAQTPVLGICLGMQLLADLSEEFGEHEGLGLVPGRVTRLQPASVEERVPNIGWCDLYQVRPTRLYEGIPSPESFYFVHSYALSCADAGDVAGIIHFGGSPMTVAVQRGRIFGVQFHPEKSQDSGLGVLSNFAAYVDENITARA